MDREISYADALMCSWCYGFAPAIAKVQATYADRASVSLMLGGLYAGNRLPLKEH
jgi:protein-disulfide isomerase-like protein with CxxC motif